MSSSAGGPVLELLPAIDVAGGAVAQASIADPDLQVLADPLAAAQRWKAAGARWLHLVDLDAAFARGSNTDVLRRVVAAVGMNVEVSGGVRDDDTLRAALGTGCRRAVLSSAALGTPTWCADVVSRYGDRVAVAIDVRSDIVVPRGSSEEIGPLAEVLEWLEDACCARYIVTDVERDGSLAGPNLDLLRNVCRRTRAAVIASGGIASLTDLSDLAALIPEGLEGAILGSALYTRTVDLAEALHLVGQNSVGA